MNYVALIKSNKTKEIIQIPLSCKEYHANKLQYVFGRTLEDCSSIVLKSNRFFTDDELNAMTRSENSLMYSFGKQLIIL